MQQQIIIIIMHLTFRCVVHLCIDNLVVQQCHNGLQRSLQLQRPLQHLPFQCVLPSQYLNLCVCQSHSPLLVCALRNTFCATASFLYWIFIIASVTIFLHVSDMETWHCVSYPLYHSPLDRGIYPLVFSRMWFG